MNLLCWYVEWVLATPKPRLVHLVEEWNELLDERVLSIQWWMELGDVIHTILRMVNRWLGIIVIPIARKHGNRMKDNAHKYVI